MRHDRAASGGAGRVAWLSARHALTHACTSSRGSLVGCAGVRVHTNRGRRRARRHGRFLCRPGRGRRPRPRRHRVPGAPRRRGRRVGLGRRDAGARGAPAVRAQAAFTHPAAGAGLARLEADGGRPSAGCTCCRLRSCARPPRPRAPAWWCSARGSCRCGQACPPRSWPACLCCTAGATERPAWTVVQQVGLWNWGDC